MTIYTFGDPELLREVLLALATIFNLVEWSDPGSAMGLGGNFLAVALIGLVGVGIAGVSTQQVRVDYLFLALVMFGIMFSAKTDVNVEDIQTGDAAVVADVPIGIAFIAAASSSAAASLTETVGTALQTVGRETSLLTDNGFLDPLRTLKSFQGIGLEDIDSLLFKSTLEYYRTCVGKTREFSPALFDTDEFLSNARPLDYMTNNARITNYTTIYYDDANPGGGPVGCHGASALIRTRMNEIADGTTPELEMFMKRARGAKLYNTSFSQTDIEDSVDLIFRGLLTGQEFMANLFVRNMYNNMEALAQAEYGTNESLYVAQVTQAFEDKKVGAGTEGTVFLQFMFPLMTFFQFLFFAIAPFVALVMVASPFSAAKLLGGYLLFGVWSYAWMPVAAIINHYMEISLQNNLSFSDVLGAGTGYTSILGFDDFYNLATTKLAIGSNALASTPIIVGAILSAGIFATANLARGLSQAGNANRVDTSFMRPKLGQNAPLVQAGGRASFAAGTVMSKSGDAGAASGAQTVAYETAQARVIGQNMIQAGKSLMNNASASFKTSWGEGVTQLNTLMSEGGFGSSISQTLQARTDQSVRNAIESKYGEDYAGSVSTATLRGLSGSLGLQAAGTGGREYTDDTNINGRKWGELKSAVQAQAGTIGASFVDGLAAEATSNEREVGQLRTMGNKMRSDQAEYDSAVAAQESFSEAGSAMMDYGKGSNVPITDITGIAFRRFGREKTKQLLQGLLASYGGAFQKKALDGARANFANKKPMGLDMLDDALPDDQDDVSSLLNFLADEAASGQDPTAVHAFGNALNLMAGVGSQRAFNETKPMLSELGTMGERMQTADGLFAKAQEETQNAQLATNKGPGGTFDSITAAANSRFARGGTETNPISADAANAVTSRFNRGRTEMVNGENSDSYLGELAPEAMGQLGAMSSTRQNITSGMQSEPTTGSEWLNNLFQPGTGANDVLLNDLAPLVNADGRNEATNDMADTAIERMQGAAIGQYNGEIDVGAIYQKYQDANFSKKQAALATYAELGRRTSGASDLFVAGLLGAGGAGAMGNYAERKIEKKLWNKSALSVARMGGFVTGGAIFAMGVGGQKKLDRLASEEAVQAIGEDLKADFRKVNPEQYAKFEQQINAQTNFEGLAQVLTEAYASGTLTDAMIDSNEFKPDTDRTFNIYGGVQTYEKMTNPFNDENFSVQAEPGGNRE